MGIEGIVAGATQQAALARAAGFAEAAVASTHAGLDVPKSMLLLRWRDRLAAIPHFREAAAQARLALRELEAVGDAYAGMRRQLTYAVEQLDPDLSSAGRVMERRRWGLPSVANTLEANGERLRELSTAADESADAMRTRLWQELDSIADKPDAEVTKADQWRIAVIRGMPDHVRPRLPYAGQLDFQVGRASAVRDKALQKHLRAIRIQQDRDALARDPAVTRAALDAEARELLQVPTKQVTAEQDWRLAVISGMPDELRPSFFRPVRMPYGDWEPLDRIAVSGELPSRRAPSMRQYAAVRLTRDIDDMLADPAFDVEAVTAELYDLMQTPAPLVDGPLARRAAMLARALGESGRRLPLDDKQLAWLENMPLSGGWLQSTSTRHTWSTVQARIGVAADPLRAARALRAAIDSGERVRPELYEVVASYPDALREAGLDAATMARGAILALDGTSGLTSSLPDLLRAVRTRIVSLELPSDELVAVRDEVIELADRNIRRMNGELHDGYMRHPDYAELGRVAQSAKLLETLAAAAPESGAAEVAGLAW